LALAGAVVAFLTLLAPSAAQAYPVLMCSIGDVDVIGGEDATVTATINSQAPSNFTLTYKGQVHTDNGVTSTTATFHTVAVSDITETTVFATVTQGGATVPCTGTITLHPRDDDGDGDPDGDGDGDGDGNGGGGGDNGGLLPNTGGERLAWLIIGGMLVVAGGGVVVASRRRDA
jgi:LPXTG-motif cell wall-anchored protein